MKSQEPNREERTVEALLGMAPGQRGPYLDQPCGEDRGLRKLVEGMLRSLEQMGALLRQRVLSRPEDFLKKDRAGDGLGEPCVCMVDGGGIRAPERNARLRGENRDAKRLQLDTDEI
jgi:hypothetical protein